MEKIEGVNLSEVLKQANEEIRRERAVEINRKVRYVLEGLASLKGRLSQIEKDFKKQSEKIAQKIKKGEDKIIQINENNWNILDSIDLKKPFDLEEKEEQKPQQAE